MSPSQPIFVPLSYARLSEREESGEIAVAAGLKPTRALQPPRVREQTDPRHVAYCHPPIESKSRPPAAPRRNQFCSRRA